MLCRVRAFSFHSNTPRPAFIASSSRSPFRAEFTHVPDARAPSNAPCHFSMPGDMLAERPDIAARRKIITPLTSMPFSLYVMR